MKTLIDVFEPVETGDAGSLVPQSRVSALSLRGFPAFGRTPLRIPRANDPAFAFQGGLSRHRMQLIGAGSISLLLHFEALGPIDLADAHWFHLSGLGYEDFADASLSASSQASREGCRGRPVAALQLTT